jgi:hypothetical protein
MGFLGKSTVEAGESSQRIAIFGARNVTIFPVDERIIPMEMSIE